jgi:predicted ferric reductase
MSLLRNTLLVAASMGQVLAQTSSPDESAPPGTPAAAPAASADNSVDPVDVNNAEYALYIFYCCAAVAFAIMLYQVAQSLQRHIRTLVCLNNEKQTYFVTPNYYLAWFKQNLFYSPLFRQRHHEELFVWRNLSLGILPTRFQSLLLMGIIAMNVTLCTLGIEWTMGGSDLLQHLRNRTGYLAVANLVILIILGGRNNPLIKWLGISFDSFNILHRWFGRIFILESIVHSVAWCIDRVHIAGWAAVQKSIQNNKLNLYGFIGLVACIAILLQTGTTVRHAFYETFLMLHNLLVAGTLVVLWLHLEDKESQIYVKVAVGFWAAERAVRLLRLLYHNVSLPSRQKLTTATVECLPGDAMRITLTLARPWTFRPGQHMFLTLPSIGLWTSHPFSVAWSSSTSLTTLPTMEKSSPLSTFPLPSGPQKTTFTLLVRRRAGLTDTLFKRASLSPNATLSLTALCEGPYGLQHTLTSYGTLLLFAGGIGITHQLPYIAHLLHTHNTNSSALRRLTLVWTIQSPEHLEWIRPQMAEVLAMPGRREVVRILLFVTRPRSAREIKSPSETVRMFPGRPDVKALVAREVDAAIGAVGVGVCGPGGMGDDVRLAVRRSGGVNRSVDLIEECFGW